MAALYLGPAEPPSLDAPSPKITSGTAFAGVSSPTPSKSRQHGEWGPGQQEWGFVPQHGEERPGWQSEWGPTVLGTVEGGVVGHLKQQPPPQFATPQSSARSVLGGWLTDVVLS